MSPVLKFCLLALFTYRLSALLTRDAGPFDILENCRLALGRRAAWTGSARGLWRTLADLSLCPLCMSVWVALPLAFIMFADQHYAVRIIYWGALSGASNILSLITEGRQA